MPDKVPKTALPWRSDNKKDDTARKRTLLMLKRAGVRPAGVARALGVTPGAVSKWLGEKGKNTPNADTLAAVVALCPLGSLDELFGIKSADERAVLEQVAGLLGRAVPGLLESQAGKHRPGP
jgi:transcriptional regulator with XRE-family HTH domain